MKMSEFKCQLYTAELDVFETLAKEQSLSGPEYFRQLIRIAGEEKGIWPPLELVPELSGSEDIAAVIALNKSRLGPPDPPAVVMPDRDGK